MAWKKKSNTFVSESSAYGSVIGGVALFSTGPRVHSRVMLGFPVSDAELMSSPCSRHLLSFRAAG